MKRQATTAPASDAKKSRVAGGWVKWEKDIEEDPRFKRMVNRLRNTSVTSALPERTVVSLVSGCLLKLWSYADSYVRADDTLDLGPDDIDALVGLPGFATAMPIDWLVVVDDQHVELPDFQTHNGIVAKRKALTQKRVANFRQRISNDGVTPEEPPSNAAALPDQTRPDQKRLDQEERKSGPSPEQAGKEKQGIPIDSLLYEQTIMATFPAAPNPPNWMIAIRNAAELVREGLATWPELVAATERYAKFIAAGGNGGVNVAAHNFFDRHKGNYWQQEWKAPETKADTARNQAQQREAEELERVKASRAGLGLPNFRDPYPGETARQYDTQLRMERNRVGQPLGAPRFPDLVAATPAKP